MKIGLAAAALLMSAPALAQTAGGGLSSAGVLTPPYIPAFETGQYLDIGKKGDLYTRIDRRNSARLQAAKMTRKARERTKRN
ncbi:hypothetical protein [uncultured Sphingomonas sp.]|uniref:hypothetical protein n=1 Tax=uncultured Sphingomonas sp. TaxID=158754 RepID=UPI0035CBF2C2